MKWNKVLIKERLALMMMMMMMKMRNMVIIVINKEGLKLIKKLSLMKSFRTYILSK